MKKKKLTLTRSALPLGYAKNLCMKRIIPDF